MRAYATLSHDTAMLAFPSNRTGPEAPVGAPGGDQISIPRPCRSVIMSARVKGSAVEAEGMLNPMRRRARIRSIERMFKLRARWWIRIMQ